MTAPTPKPAPPAFTAVQWFTPKPRRPHERQADDRQADDTTEAR